MKTSKFKLFMYIIGVSFAAFVIIAFSSCTYTESQHKAEVQKALSEQYNKLDSIHAAATDTVYVAEYKVYFSNGDSTLCRCMAFTPEDLNVTLASEQANFSKYSPVSSFRTEYYEIRVSR